MATVALNPMDLTLQDLEDLETHFGMTFATLDTLFKQKELDPLAMDHKVLGGLAFMACRLNDPEVGPNYVKRMKFSELIAVLSKFAGEDDATVDPT